jgi:hypothetical protein
MPSLCLFQSRRNLFSWRYLRPIVRDCRHYLSHFLRWIKERWTYGLLTPWPSTPVTVNPIDFVDLNSHRGAICLWSFWHITSCRFVNIYRPFGGAHCLYIKDNQLKMKAASCSKLGTYLQIYMTLYPSGLEVHQKISTEIRTNCLHLDGTPSFYIFLSLWPAQLSTCTD